MFEGLDRINWASMNHAYGSAEDVPELLHRLVSNDPEERELGLGGMYGAVHHQGDIYDCTVASIPFLLQAVANPNVPGRGEILGLLASIGGADTPSFDYHPEEGSDAESDDRTLQFQHARMAHEAVLAKYSTYLALLADPDPAVREKVPEVLSACWEQATRIIPALQDRLISETDQQSRIHLIEAIGALADRAAKGQTGQVDIDAVSSWLVERAAADADPAVRLSALIQIARNVPARLPSNVLTTVLDILVDESTNKIEAANCVAECGSAAAPFAPQVRALLTDPLPIVRVQAAAALWAITADVEAALPVLLADWDDSPQVRIHATRCIAKMGSAAQSAIPVLHGELARVRRHTYRPSGSGSHDVLNDEALLEECAVALTRITGKGPIALSR